MAPPGGVQHASYEYVKWFGSSWIKHTGIGAYGGSKKENGSIREDGEPEVK